MAVLNDYKARFQHERVQRLRETSTPAELLEEMDRLCKTRWRGREGLRESCRWTRIASCASESGQGPRRVLADSECYC